MSRIKQFKLPDLGEGLTEGEILTWLVKVGDTVELNQPIVEVETAKAAVEIPSPYVGVVTQLFFGEGVTVEVGAPIIEYDTDPGAGALPEAPAAPAAAAPAAGAKPEREANLVGYGPRTGAATRRARKGGAPAHAPAPAPVAVPVAAAPVAPAPAPVAVAPVVVTQPAALNGAALHVLAKPPVRKLAKDLGVPLAGIVGTGPQGSITRDDVQAALSAPATTAAPVRVTTTGGETRIPIKGVRKLTAENMVRSAFTAPHVTEFLTLDVTRGVNALERLKKQREWRDVRISPLLLVMRAVTTALKRYPMVNSSWDEAAQEIVVKDYVNLGIAAATPRGLIVPNIKDAGSLSFLELAAALTGLVGTARDGKTSPADMSGGTFTITNVGVYGVDTGTPILPPGESAILAFGAIREMPWVHKGKVKPRQVTTLGLSFDHRIIDGELGSKFLADIGAFLADPEAALLGWS
ncbi:dihydrolipoamide acetyltransferase component of pyruvate dehydrogenase complex [Longispora fulva]|uniref:Dihydrolipoamide acetyltransferase component of pyruvate dehydrogenase complex n=1 Tax=Longispora fulva TaxID=619741 RepID=A0A8J7GKW0_9ACTN|nr:dihydrolipoamide acetyltransferase family protein [Longispora fulva]MBG6139540.1 pyruvate dehydrogenase E2 component (dihydrolipoamide acetyltransferase) [Longispora fulva]GIG58077.1 dihydrolipoamide acetyltransferase component of pyruvate dehydrogenase complex [Longispora fulva]